MPIIDTRALAVREVKPGWHGRFFDSSAMSFALYDIDAGATLHEHCHANEEVWNVLAGELEISIGAQTFRVPAGTSAVVPPNTAHSVRALAASSALIVDHPLRAGVGGGERAALSVEFPQTTLGTSIALTLQNHGRACGTLLCVELESGLAATLPEARATAVPQGAMPLAIEIAGGGTLTLERPCPPLSAAEFAAVQAREHVYFVRGALIYASAPQAPRLPASGLVTPALHHTTFCRVFEPGRGFVAPAEPGYNYGD